MSDETITSSNADAQGQAAQTSSAAPEPQQGQTQSTAAAPGYKTSAPDLGLLGGDQKAESNDGFDWRAAASAGDAKKLGALSRFKDLNTFAESFFNAQERIRKGALSAPMEGAAPEELSAYRESLGIPATPDAYDFPGAFTDADKPVIDGFKSIAHAANMAPAQVAAVAKWYDDFQQQVITQRTEANNAHVKELRAQLIEEMGPRDFERGAMLSNQFLQDKGALDLAKVALADGMPLGAHPQFVKLIMGLARDYSSDDLVAAVEAPNSTSVDARLEEIYGLMNSDPAKYNSESIQKELVRLTSIQETRASRRAA